MNPIISNFNKLPDEIEMNDTHPSHCIDRKKSNSNSGLIVRTAIQALENQINNEHINRINEEKVSSLLAGMVGGFCSIPFAVIITIGIANIFFHAVAIPKGIILATTCGTFSSGFCCSGCIYYYIMKKKIMSRTINTRGDNQKIQDVINSLKVFDGESLLHPEDFIHSYESLKDHTKELNFEQVSSFEKLDPELFQSVFAEKAFSEQNVSDWNFFINIEGSTPHELVQLFNRKYCQNRIKEETLFLETFLQKIPDEAIRNTEFQKTVIEYLKREITPKCVLLDFEDISKLLSDIKKGSSVKKALFSNRKIIKSKIPTNVTFNIKGKLVSANKELLIEKSEFFKVNFLEQWEKDNQEEVVLNENECDLFQMMISFIHGENIVITEKNCLPLLKMADFYIVDEVRKICEKSLIEHFSSNALETYLGLLRTYQLPMLKSFIEKIYEEKLQKKPILLHSVQFKKVKQPQIR